MNKDLSIRQQKARGTEERNNDILKKYDPPKVTQEDLAKEYGIGQPRISRIIKRAKEQQTTEPNFWEKLLRGLIKFFEG